MTGYKSKKAAAQAKLEDDDTQVYQTELTKLLMESYDKGVADALEETKAALAQPAQEPFGYFRYDARFDAWVQNCENNQGTPFYTAPSQRPWVGLTDEEIAAFDWNHAVVDAECVRAIEAKLKEKNT